MIDLSTCQIDSHEIGHGQCLYLCWAREAASPVGLMWGIHFASDAGKNVFLALGSYVPAQFRRQGVCQFMHEAIDAVILTPNGSKQGKAFMRAAGYKVDKVTGMYVLGC